MKKAPTLKIEIGDPTHILHLRYQVLYPGKPFETAAVYLYSNGIYLILSPGEHHWGVYVTIGDSDNPTWAMSFISLPSDDWGENLARHDLTFNRISNVFTQQLYIQDDQNAAKQHGTFERFPNNVADPTTLNWENIPQPK
ncbi:MULTISPECIES: hypothetical protein [Pseudomonas]|uniref:Uncharacterized protein n=2 Tax=Pseudomonas TaxID=286 RepID=A0A0D0TGC2_PSEFL|nr:MULTISPECIES: hypothetical protein [Pseudomonas fluorescens group]AZE64200.1 putative conserved secreted protein [Pseudomonas synxantha]KIR22501.1 hypothetical protein PFLU3_20010 [Pseudomonas fluorescens]